MAKDVVLENLKGFVTKGARAEAKSWVSTGHFNLDFAIKYGMEVDNVDLGSLEGYDPTTPMGLPTGRIVELFGAEASGKSSLAYRVCGFAQKADKTAAWIDTEHSFEESLAELNGCNVDELLYSDLYDHNHPDKNFFAEDILDMIIALCKADINVIVLDSVANLIPKEVDENTADQQNMAKLARLLSAQMGKVAHYAAKHNTLVIFINQIREKVGVVYGCFHYNSRVVLSDGSTEKIGKIVNQKLPLEVMSCNIETGEIAPKKIIGWHNNGNIKGDECFFQFVVNKYGGNGRTQFGCTKNHILFNAVTKYVQKNGDVIDKDGLNNGLHLVREQLVSEEVMAKDLEIGDHIFVAQPFYLTPDQRQLVYGSILGDGSIRRVRGKDSCAHLRLCHGADQKEYCKWKQEILEPWICCVDDHEGEHYSFDTIPMYELTDLIYRNDDYVKIPDEVINNIDALGLAIWYLDDGTYQNRNYQYDPNIGRSWICCTKFQNREDMMMVFERFDLHPKLGKIGFSFNQTDTTRLHEIIAPFVPPCLDYKLNPNMRNKYSYEIEDQADKQIRYEAINAEILDIYEKPPTKTKRKFDLTIQDFGTYIVDGAIVHNSPETTPGGRALKFNSSVRLKMTKIGNADAVIVIEDEESRDGKKVIGRYSRVNIEKNRMSPPLLDSGGSAIPLKVPVYYRPYFPDLAERLFDSGRKLKLIKTRKGTFSWEDEKVEGRLNFIKHIDENGLKGKLMDAIKKEAEEQGEVLPPEIIMASLVDEEEKQVKSEDNGEKKVTTRGRKKRSS